MPCPYAHSLGVPGQGVHAAGIGGYSLNDILGTIGLAVTTAYFTHTGFFEVAGMARIGRILTLCFRNTNSLSYNSRDKGVP